MELKLGDFGLAAKLKSKSDWRYTVCGTPNYIAPEVLNKEGQYLYTDIWSFGIVLYTLAYG
jgi:serine/threonine protein kinase